MRKNREKVKFCEALSAGFCQAGKFAFYAAEEPVGLWFDSEKRPQICKAKTPLENGAGDKVLNVGKRILFLVE